MQAIFDRLLLHDTIAFESPGNRMCREYYAGMAMPWDLSPAVNAFPEQQVKWMTWDRGGLRNEADEFFLGNQSVSMEELKEQWTSYSQVTRWQKANQDLVGTDMDVVKKAIEEVRGLAGDRVVVGRSCMLLMFKKQ